MKHIVKFNQVSDANNYEIKNVPFLTTVGENNQLLTCNEENKKIVVDGQGNASIVDSKPIIICHTQIVDSNWYENYVEIEFEEGMTWGDFVNSSYNDESKMTGEESCIGKFSIDSEGYVNAPFSGTGPRQYSTPQKGTDKVISDIEYEVPRHSHCIYYDEGLIPPLTPI